MHHGDEGNQGWKTDSKGYYTRQIGWKLSKSGKLAQHKFILGTDLREAQRRESNLRELWENFEATQEDPRPHWPPGLLEIARHVAKGAGEVPIPRRPDEMQVTYADRIRRMQLKYPVVCFVPSDQHAYDVGQEALQVFESIPGLPAEAMLSVRATDQEVVEAWTAAQTLLEKAGLAANLDQLKTIAKSARRSASAITTAASTPIPPPTTDSSESASESVAASPTASLYQALKAYQRYLKKEFHRPELEQISPWGKTQLRQITTLMQHHENMLLSRLDAQAVDELFGYWRRRPCRKGTTTPVTAKSAGHYLSALGRFLKWLHKQPTLGWRKPADFDEIDKRVRRLPSDHARKKLDQVDTFSLAELQLLMRFGQPFDRTLILLALTG